MSNNEFNGLSAPPTSKRSRKKSNTLKFEIRKNSSFEKTKETNFSNINTNTNFFQSPLNVVSPLNNTNINHPTTPINNNNKSKYDILRNLDFTSTINVPMQKLSNLNNGINYQTNDNTHNSLQNFNILSNNYHAYDVPNKEQTYKSPPNSAPMTFYGSISSVPLNNNTNIQTLTNNGFNVNSNNIYETQIPIMENELMSPQKSYSLTTFSPNNTQNGSSDEIKNNFSQNIPNPLLYSPNPTIGISFQKNLDFFNPQTNSTLNNVTNQNLPKNNESQNLFQPTTNYTYHNTQDLEQIRLEMEQKIRIELETKLRIEYEEKIRKEYEEKFRKEFEEKMKISKPEETFDIKEKKIDNLQIDQNFRNQIESNLKNDYKNLNTYNSIDNNKNFNEKNVMHLSSTMKKNEKSPLYTNNTNTVSLMDLNSFTKSPVIKSNNRVIDFNAYVSNQEHKKVSLITPLNASIKLQSLVRMFIEKRRFKEIRLRTKTAKEILSSEDVYVSLIQKYVETFLDKINTSFPEIPENYYQILSFPMRSILEFNSKLLERLKKRLENWNYLSTMGDVFMSLDFIPVYGKYITNYDNCMNIIQWYNEKDPKFSKLIQTSEEILLNTIQSFIILPIQRIPRYILLLEQMLKRTPSNHIDHYFLCESKKALEVTGNEINQKKRIYDEKRDIVNELKRIKALIFPDLEELTQNNRKFLLEGDIVVISNKKYKRKFFLFNDLFLLTSSKTKKKKKFLLKSKIEIKVSNKIRLEDMKDDQQFLNTSCKNSFLFHSVDESLFIFCNSLVEKNNLFSLLQNCLNSINKN